MKKVPKLNWSEQKLVLRARRGGLEWPMILKIISKYKDTDQFLYALKKTFGNNLPPSGELTRSESLLYLKDKDMLPNRFQYKALLENKNYQKYKDHVKQCKQWYGIEFEPSPHPHTLYIKKKG